VKVVYSEAEKRATLETLKSKGSKRPPNWKLIHSESCDENELRFDHGKLIKRLSNKFRLGSNDLKFAVSVVSNPNETSSLDRGVIKIRYRYVLSAAHRGESLIKSNSREFCVTLVAHNKLYRLEDINMMSFRGANPISSQNYSIFKLRGHWNCRHTWQREVYLVERDNKNVENNELINKTLEMKEDKKGLVAQFKVLLSKKEKPLTQAEAVELSKELVKNTVQTFKDVKVDDAVMRVEGDELVAGATVAWADKDGELTAVENGEYTVKEDKVILVVENSMISEVKPLDGEETDEDKKKAAAKAEEEKLAAEKKAKDEKSGEFNAEESIKEINARIEQMQSNFKAETEAQITELGKTMTASFSEALKNVPAFNSENTSQNFSSSENNKDNKYSHLSVTGN